MCSCFSFRQVLQMKCGPNGCFRADICMQKLLCQTLQYRLRNQDNQFGHRREMAEGVFCVQPFFVSSSVKAKVLIYEWGLLNIWFTTMH